MGSELTTIVTTNSVTCNCILLGYTTGHIFGYVGVEYKLYVKRVDTPTFILLNTYTSNITIDNSGWSNWEEPGISWYNIPEHTFTTDSTGASITFVEEDNLYFIVTLTNVALDSTISKTSSTISGPS